MRTLLTVLIALLTSPCAAEVADSRQSLGEAVAGVAVSQRVERNRTTIAVSGPITWTVATGFIRALEAAPAGRPVVVELDSPGGYVSAGYAMIDAMLGARSAGRSVTTLVRGDAACESMCFGLFMAGNPRRAEPGAYFMVHAPRDERTGAMSVKTVNEMIARLISLGTSQAWIGTVREHGGFSGRVDYGVRAEELTLAGANVVTELVAAH